MRTRSPQGLFLPTPRLNQLRILEQIAVNPGVTQAELARSCSLSVAMVNNYMKELCDLQLLEYQRKNSKTITYHVTPAGKEATESIRHELLLEWGNLLSEAHEQVVETIRTRAHREIKRVVLYGSGVLAEIVFHALDDAGVNIIGVCTDDPAEVRREWCGREKVSPSQVRYMMPDAVVIAQPNCNGETLRALEPLSLHGIEVITFEGRTLESLDHSQMPALAHVAI